MLNLRNLFVASALAMCAVAFAACGGGSTNVTPTPGPTCSPGTTVQMIYPIPGATGVPDAPQQIVFAVATPLPNIWNLYISNASNGNGSVNGYTAAGFQTISASQVPSPSATPSFANPTYQSVTLTGSLGPPGGTEWWVWVNDSAGNCTPMGPVGSFTIQ
jgi:hypothetical protein